MSPSQGAAVLAFAGGELSGGRRRVVVLAVCLLVVGGCTTSHFRRSADKEVAKIIAQKTPAVPNMDPRFTIDQTNIVSLADLRTTSGLEPFLGTEALSESNAPMISLERALALAVNHNRDYQTQKELVYLQALNLTLDRQRFTPIFSSGANAAAQNQPKDVAKAVDELAGTQSSLLQRETEVVQQYNVSGRGSLSASVLLRSGATIANSFSVDFLRFLNGDPRFYVRSSLGATITQPLLRGAGYRATMENLTQAERNLLYGLRDFTLYRKDFSVRVARTYYQVLQARDAARNQWLGHQNLLQEAKRGRAFAEEGRRSQADLGLLEQNALSAETSWINAVRAYKQGLDQFKILLGVPAETRLVLDEQELIGLQVQHPALSAEEATQVALATRLDLQTAKDRWEDADRRVKVAANGLKPRADLVVSGSVDNQPDSNNPFALDFQRARGSVGMNLDPALDRKPQRNAYRSALITLERAKREYRLREDQIKLELYEGWRNLDQAKRNYQTSELSVKLAERRVEEQQLRSSLGQSIYRDLVDAQTALIRSRNERTSALVEHTTARLQFWRDMGILYIKENGQWQTISDARR